MKFICVAQHMVGFYFTFLSSELSAVVCETEDGWGLVNTDSFLESSVERNAVI